MNKENELKSLTTKIKNRLSLLEGYFWDVFVETAYYDEPNHVDEVKDDKETYLFHGTKELYYWICLFLELRNLSAYLDLFITKFNPYIDDKGKVLDSRNPLYQDSEPSMIILDDFRNFLSAFPEFSEFDKVPTDKLYNVLSATSSILEKTNIQPKAEPIIYKTVHWFLAQIYPKSKLLNRAKFFDLFTSYIPDILIPEIASAVEYKFIRKGKNIANYLNELKTDADNYKGDSNYRFFYAVVFFEVKSELNQPQFKAAILEKGFPDNWTIIAL